jgi:hypothetical protein
MEDRWQHVGDTARTFLGAEESARLEVKARSHLLRRLGARERTDNPEADAVIGKTAARCTLQSIAESVYERRHAHAAVQPATQMVPSSDQLPNTADVYAARRNRRSTT